MMRRLFDGRPETALFLMLGLVALTLAALDGIGPGVSQAQIGVLVIAVAILGLPHGALDPLIARRHGLWRGMAGFVGFNLAYLALATSVVAAWLLLPVVSLLVFLLLSAWHFGGDWAPDAGALGRFALGVALLSLPAAFNADAVTIVYTHLSGETAGRLVEAQRHLAPVAAIGLAAAALRWAFDRSSEARTSAAELAALAVFGLFLPPLVYFLVYFCGLHSPRHLRRRWSAARMQSQAVSGAAGALGPGIWALGYTLAALALGALLLAVLPGAASPDSALLRVCFIGLAALTVPHMLLIDLRWRKAVE